MIDPDLLERIRQDPRAFFTTGAAQSEIDAMYATVDVPLPESYLAFLKEFNGGEFRSIRMHRIGENALQQDSQGKPLPFYFGDVVGTARTLKDHIPGVAEGSFFPFGDDFGGNYYCFDLTRMQDGECPIIQFLHECVKPTFTERAANLTELFQVQYPPGEI